MRPDRGVDRRSVGATGLRTVKGTASRGSVQTFGELKVGEQLRNAAAVKPAGAAPCSGSGI